MPAVIVGLGGLAFSLLIAINSAYNLAKSAGGIYSTVTGAGTFYDKAKAFARDAALMMMSVFFLKGAVTLGTKSLSTCKSAVQELIGRTTCVKTLEVIQEAKGIETITSLEEFLECVKGFLDEDALRYAKELLNNDADDIVELKKIARLMEEGSRKIGKKMSKEEFKAGLDALWGDGGVKGALVAIERCLRGFGGKQLLKVETILLAK